MLYTITNPSDPYTIEANSLEVAAVACIFLGRGQYEFKPVEDTGETVPFFMFGGTDEWFEKHFGKTVDVVTDEVMANRLQELADCLDSCLIGKVGDREPYFKGLEAFVDPKERQEYWFAYHDKKRSSFNDIGGRAKKMAANFREKIKTIELAPQQVFAGK
jgi:hypothetical protein